MKVIESKKSLYVKVEQQDVERALRLDKQFCVMAMACRRTINGLIDIEVGSSITKLIFHNKVIRFETSPEARKRLEVFDRTGEWPFDIGKNLIGLPVSPNNRLDRERNRNRKARAEARAEGRNRYTGARAGFPHRKSARRISPRHVNFSSVIRQERLAAHSAMVVQTSATVL